MTKVYKGDRIHFGPRRYTSRNSHAGSNMYVEDRRARLDDDAAKWLKRAERAPMTQDTLTLGALFERIADLEARIATLTRERDEANEERSNLRAALAIAESSLRKVADL